MRMKGPNRGQLTRWYAMHLPRPPVPAWPARAPPILLRPTSPPVRDHRKRNLPSTTVTIVALVNNRLHPTPQASPSTYRPPPKAREPPRTSTECAVQSNNKTRSKNSEARSCHVAAERPNQLPTPNTAADAAAIASRGQFRLAFGQHLDLPGYLAGAADCPMKAPRPPVPLPAAMSLSMLPLLRPASCSWMLALFRLTSWWARVYYSI